MFASRKRYISRRARIAIGIVAATSLVLAGCSDSNSGGSEGAAGGDAYSIGINQLVQHPALDEATAGFKAAFDDAGIDVQWDEQNANGEQSTALTIAQQLAGSQPDLVLSVATPAAQATTQAITDIQCCLRQSLIRWKPSLSTPLKPQVETLLVPQT